LSRVDVSPPPTRAPRLAVLDGLRLVAALAVAIYHYTVAWRIDGFSLPQYHLPTMAHVSVYGFLGVELFFLISGFVICMSSWGRRLGDFFTSRVSRLYPAYWVCILITAAVVAIVPVTTGVPPAAKLSLTDIMVNLTMLQQPLGVPHVDGVYWTLFVELRFYLLFAILVRVGLTYRRAVLFCAIWMTLAVFAPTLDNSLITMLAIPEYAPYFIAGIAMYLIHRFGPTPLLYGIVGFAWLVSLQRVEARLDLMNPGFPLPKWPGFLVITACYAIMLVIALGKTDRITWRWLTVAGAVTYPFYLLHQGIGYSVLRTAFKNVDLPVWSLIAVTTVVMVVLAWLVHRTIERPLARVVRSAIRRGLAEARRPEPVAALPAPGDSTPSRPVQQPVATRPAPRPPRLRDRPPTR
jgi:peptidoglycan/LPS O-acetylase OafA/YrhL